MEVPVGYEAFYSRHFPLIALKRQHETGKHGFAVQKNRAGTALSQFASVLGPSVAQVLAKHLQQGFVGSERDINFLTVQRNSDTSCFLGFGR
jgi:hypothetical protein